MVKIYFSYSTQDMERVKVYLAALRDGRREIIEPFKIDGNSVSRGNGDELELADCVIFYITDNSLGSDAVRSEIELATGERNLKPRKNQLIILLIEGKPSIPVPLNRFLHIYIDNNSVYGVIGQINALIESFLSNVNNEVPNSSDTEPLEISSYMSAEPAFEEVVSGMDYWLLKINGENWAVLELEAGEIGYFNSSFNSRRKRPDYDLFVDLKVGDKGMAYDYSVTKTVVFLFTILESLHKDEVYGEVVNFRIDQIISNGPADLAGLSELEFAGDLNDSSLRKLFILTEDQYNNILRLAIEAVPSPRASRRVLSNFFADSAAGIVKDELDFTSDVNALASVMAYREVKPPLAIGLFGNWGSGKSFFMNILQQRIDELSKDSGDVFCKKVLQINFNSWHYSDSNLWASLITKIFEDLEKFGKGKPDELNQLFQSLNSTQELLEETMSERQRIQSEITALVQEKGIFDTEVERKSKNLESLSWEEIFGGLMKDESIQKELKKLNEKYSFLNLNAFDEIEDNLRKVDSFADRLWESVQLFFSFFEGWKLFLVLLFFVLTFAAIYGMIANVDFFKGYLEKFLAIASMISGSLTLYVKYMRPAENMVNTAFNRLSSLNETVNGLKEQAKIKFRAQHEELVGKLEKAQSVSEEIERKINLFKVEESKLKAEIDEISSGRKIIRFIESRVADIRYTNSLGIISWIRKDFEQLDSLLRQQEAGSSLSGVAPVAKAFELERIILYIDDLDRCSAPIVVKVLEAIHLLLAFPLFVVVVGVDPRWMQRALNSQYGNLLAGTNGLAEDDTGGNSSETGIPASSYDYLEKIFQVPFALKPIDQKGKGDLIRSQLESSKPNALGISGVAENQRPREPVHDNGDLPNLSGDGGDVAGIPEPKVPDAVVTVASIESENLQLTAVEVNFMQQISFLIGDSPRTIKRYINMYRIIRTHSRFRVDGEDPDKDYFSTMILLAIITGLPDQANELFARLKSEEDNTSFHEFVDKHVAQVITKPELLREIKDRLRGSNEQGEMVGKVKVGVFKRNMGLVSRFSFRNIG